jgi:hypothetical protein
MMKQWRTNEMKRFNEMEGFNSLELFFKGQLLRKNAQHLMSAVYCGNTADLYSWDNYLIELYFDSEKAEVTRITLAGKSDLDKYMKDISLADLGILSVV